MEEATNNDNNSNSNDSNNNNNNCILETLKAERAMWLMKCPSLVYRSLQSAASSSPSSINEDDAVSSRPVVAKVLLSIDPLTSNENDSSSPQFTMELASTESGSVPKCYSMDMSKDFIPMSVFSESSQAGKISVEGKILNKFDMRPHDGNLENYWKLCRERTNKYMTKSRQIQVIDNDNGTHMRPLPGMMISSGFGDKKKLPVKGSDMKRTRRDRGEMEEIMFKLFERQPNWTLRQLIQETDQPEQFLKDMLKDLCVYNNKGTNQGSYELKIEYKRSGEEPTAK
ncbi:TFIIF_beta domain-containing protein [Cephalotus follicularis]|uniref:TFIIF_beta domain-containing protein n=1 Tax=Cephalotus follicularis TaxID=3775 RepID=A0A1Q3C040_CEPFO|nr:TFIIF_beta domain-containing protein [Cephalotus follicularis]